MASFLVASLAGLGANASAANIINVIETGGDNEPTDTITAKWNGQTFSVSVANEPIPGAVVGTTYTAGTFGHHVPAFVDRNHRYANDPGTGGGNPLNIPGYLLGHEYILSGNDNRDNASYVLDVTIGFQSIFYMLIDNRLGDAENVLPPTFGPTKMQWILDDGWAAVMTGANRLGSMSRPDEVAIDEGADGTINQWYSVYSKTFEAGTLRLRQADNAGQNMYGVVVAVVPEPGVIGFAALGALALVLRRRS
ncbi:MAG: hypothetical protein FJ405_02745 [Verrucomicrobia bacterium]|nr:hypothetical protein [Verrucomicrobiota bacterium]